MTSKIDLFSTLVSGFSSTLQGATTDNFEHTVSFRSSTVIKSGSTLIPSTVYSGAEIISKDSELLVSSGASYSKYTNFEKVAIKSKPVGVVGDNAVMAFKYLITKLNTDADNNYTTSYDDFEKIDPNYNKDEIEISLSMLDGFSLSLVIAKAPSNQKINYPEKFNSDISDSDSFWKYRASSIEEVCNSDRVKSHERFIFLRSTVNGVKRDLTIGSFTSINLTELGYDGRFAYASDIYDEMAQSGISLTPDSEGVVRNVLKYPLRSGNSVYDVSKISKTNPLTVEFSAKIDKTRNTIYANCSVSDLAGSIKLDGISLGFAYTAPENIYSTFKLSSKCASSDITLRSIEVDFDSEDTSTGVSNTGKYTAPEIYPSYQIGNGSEIYINDADGVFSIPNNAKLIIRAQSRSLNVDVNKVFMSINGGAFVRQHAVVFDNGSQFGTFVVRAYIEGDSLAGASEPSIATFVVNKTLTSPIISLNVSGEISMSSDSDVVYSTDGAVPDMENWSNVALYVKPIKLKTRTIVKAYSYYNGLISELSTFVFDPLTAYQGQSTLATYTLTGSNLNGEYLTAVTLDFSGVGVVKYTLDGSDPLLEGNLESTVYTGPTKILPIGSALVNLRYSTIESGKRPVTSGVITIPFAFKCNPWTVSKSSESVVGSVVTANGNVKLSTGTALARKSSIVGDFYLNIPIVEVSGNSSIVFGFDSYLSTINNISEGEYTGKWKIPSITFTDKVGKVVTCNVGYRKGLADKNHFDEVAKFNWNIEHPLNVCATIIDEVVPYESSEVYFAKDMLGRVYSDNPSLNGLKGVIVDPTKSVIVVDVPAYEKRVLILPDKSNYDEDIEFTITKKGNAEGSELIVANSSGYIMRPDIAKGYIDSASLTEEKTFSVFIAADGPWSMVEIDNLEVYRSSKKIKLTVNGIETEYQEASNKKLDYFMMRLCAVNSENLSTVSIGSIHGGCL